MSKENTCFLKDLPSQALGERFVGEEVAAWKVPSAFVLDGDDMVFINKTNQKTAKIASRGGRGSPGSRHFQEKEKADRRKSRIDRKKKKQKTSKRDWRPGSCQR